MELPKYNILVVDDEIHNLEALERAFRGEYRVFAAKSGHEAIKLMEKEEFALILTDQRMPGITGVELLAISLKYFPNAMRMILTSYTDTDELLEAINTGQVYRYILKPWNAGELRITVKRALETYLLAQELERRMHELSLLVDISSSLNAMIEVEEILSFSTAKISEVLEAENTSIILAERDELYLPSVDEGNDNHPRLLNHYRFPFNSGICGWVIREGKGLLVPNATEDPRYDPQIDSFGVSHLRSIICIPLKSKGVIIGAIATKNKLDSIFSQEDLHLLNALAGNLAISIENARLYKELRDTKDLLSAENIFLKQEVGKKYKFDQIIGNSLKMRKVFNLLEKVIDTPTTVLIQGETGTGKELIARAIHYNSQRKNRRFVYQNCSALPETLLESELFGHKKGAFTDAVTDRKGLFEIADGGTIFLDEISNTSPAMQAKLLRILEEGEIRPLGDHNYKRIDVRIISATNKDLKMEIEAGRFREDLYYRLNVFPIVLPPLRERKDDIALLANHFLTKFSQRMNKSIKRLSKESMEALLKYPFPGNVRELEHEIERAVTIAPDQGIIHINLLSDQVRQGDKLLALALAEKGNLKQTVEKIERHMIEEALTVFHGNKSKAAKELGLSRVGLQKKVKRYGINQYKGL
jgi:transcriptional regulator with GAF, ATPase, and Fis domain